MKKAVPLSKARETPLFGSKAVGLGDAARQGLPVPPGVALSGDLVEAVASGDGKAIEKLAQAIASLAAPFAVRSSAVDEDGAAASFAGQHLTVLNVHSAHDVPPLSARSVVCQLTGHHLPPACLPVHPAERWRCRPTLLDPGAVFTTFHQP